MENVLLTLQEAAELSEKSEKALRVQIGRGKLEAKKIQTGVKCGFEYRIPLQELSDRAQQKYFAACRQTSKIPELAQVTGVEAKEPISLEELTAEQREDAWFWDNVLSQWKEELPMGKGKTEATAAFVERWNAEQARKISVRTLYDKNKAYKEYGVAGLADGRLAREKKGRNIDEKLWSTFLQWYLDENKPSLSYLYTILKEYAEMEGWAIRVPSEATFRRAVQEIPVAVIKYFREGGKVFEDECLPYVNRIYEGITSNEYWSADYHTLDLMVRDDLTGEVYRPYLIVWTDIRSRKILSMRLRKSANSDGSWSAFRAAAKLYGLPVYVYLDNGREFLVHDFGGRGRRKTDGSADYGTNILDRLQIKMVNARVKNGKAKVIERTFKQVTSEFAKLFITYCGNRPGNRPERHTGIMKDPDNIPLASEVLADLEAYINGIYNQKSSKAKGLNGMSPNEAYATNLLKKRVITEDQANVLLLRCTRKQSIQREGVYVAVGEKKVWYFDEELVSQHMRDKVYVRYDPDDMSSARIYDVNEKFMGVMDRMLEGGYDAAQDVEAIKQVYAGKRQIERTVKNFMAEQEAIMEAPELRDAVMGVARRNMERENIRYEAAVLELFPQQEEREETMQAAVGGLPMVDLSKMARNAARRKGEDHV